MRPVPERIMSATASKRIACVRGAACRASRAMCLSALLLLSSALLALAQGRADSGVAQAPTQEGTGPHTHRASQQLNHLRPVLEWSWGAVGATEEADPGDERLAQCLTVIGLFQVVQGLHALDTPADNILALDAVVFLFACLLAYASLRSRAPGRRRRLERMADGCFLWRS
jgi:hypothetical protein